MENITAINNSQLCEVFGLNKELTEQVMSILFRNDQERLIAFLNTSDVTKIIWSEVDELKKEDIERYNESKLFGLYKHAFYNSYGISYDSYFESKGNISNYLKDLIRQKLTFSYSVFSSRLVNDAALLKEKFNFESEFTCQLNLHGDPHDFGQQVIELTDRNGVTVFYKPRSINGFSIIEEAIKSLKKKLNITIFSPNVIPMNGYGWLEEIKFIDSVSYDDPQFAKSYGALIALAHFLGLSDLHSENVRWTKNGVVIIDIDVMFRAIETTEVDELAGYSLPHSTGLIPFNDILGNSHNPISINKPETAYLISSTYLSAIKLLIKDEELITYIKCNAKNLTCRYIPRNTATYSQVLDKIMTKCISNNGVYFLRVLANLFPAVKAKPLLRKFTQSELEQLLHLDIPFFYREVTNSKAYNFLNIPKLNGLEFFEYKLKALREHLASTSHILTLQSFLISLKLNIPKTSSKFPKDKFFLFENDQHATYVSYCMHGTQWAIFPMGVDLYSGLSGVLLKNIIVNNERHADRVLIKKIARHIFYKIEHLPYVKHLGYLSGVSGAFLALGIFLKEYQDDYINLNAVHDLIVPKIHEVDNLDLYDGLAGIICAYHLVTKYCDKTIFSSFLKKICTDFVTQVHKKISELLILDCGVAHGISGICLALNISKKYIGSEHSQLIDTTVKILLEIETDKYLNRETENFSVWCKGGFGMIKVRELLGSTYKLSELKTKHMEYQNDMDGWCHGIHSVLIMGDAIELNKRNFRTSAPYRQQNLGLFTGEAGIDLANYSIDPLITQRNYFKDLVRDLLFPS